MENPLLLYSLELGAAILFWLVYVVLESAVLQLVNWGDFRRCLRGSLLANLASGLVVVASLALIPRLGLTGLIAGGLAAILIERMVFGRLNNNASRSNWVAAILANLVSFFVLTLPIFIYTNAYA